MARERADLGFSDALDEFNPAEWRSPKGRTVNDRPAALRPEKAATNQAAAAAGFRSREPKPTLESKAGEVVTPRRRRTGRNAQFNLKTRPETIAAFFAVADRQGWGLGETLEKAVALLEREYEV
jgi:hypothetical protein